MEAALEKSAMRKIYLRLLPFAVLSYILAYIDRINVSFAGLTMRGDLKLSATDFGFALGTFFLGYFIFEVPSNVIMEKVGARIWIARIMITWGIFAGAMAFVFDTTSFSIVRFLLGVAEAGFFPGMLLYFTYWFPRRHHARIVSGFLVGLPVAVALGAPISTGLLGLGRPVRAQGLADHVHRRGDPHDRGRLPDAARADRPSRAGEIPHDRGKGVGHGQDRLRAPAGQGSREVRFLEGACPVVDVPHHHRGEPRALVLHAANQNVARRLLRWRAACGGRPPSLHLRHHRLAGVGSHRRSQPLESDDQCQGAAAGRELFRHRHGEPRHALFHPADHQVARRFLQHGGRLAHHDPLHLRRYRHGGVGPSLRRNA